MTPRVTSFLALCLTISVAVAAGDGFFFESFDGVLTDNWNLVGVPSSGISDSIGNPAPSMYPNGDHNYDSGVVSKGTFSFTNGLLIEADFWLPSTFHADPGCAIGLLDTNLGTYQDPGSFQQGNSHSVQLIYASPLGGELRGYILAPGDRSSALANKETFYWAGVGEFLDDWHRFGVSILPSGYVEIHVDGTLLFISSAPLSSQYDGASILLGRQTDQTYIDNVLVLEGDHVIALLMAKLDLGLPEAESLFTQYPESRLRECLQCCSGNLADFTRCLNPESEDGRLRLLSITHDGPVSIVVQNVGREFCVGSPSVVVGLSYAQSWVPEWHTQFYTAMLEDVVLPPGGTCTLVVTPPDVPESSIDILASRLANIWTGYEDPDPATDYIGFVVTIGASNPVFGYLPATD